MSHAEPRHRKCFISIHDIFLCCDWVRKWSHPQGATNEHTHHLPLQSLKFWHQSFHFLFLLNLKGSQASQCKSAAGNDEDSEITLDRMLVHHSVIQTHKMKNMNTHKAELFCAVSSTQQCVFWVVVFELEYHTKYMHLQRKHPNSTNKDLGTNLNIWTFLLQGTSANN